MHQNFSHLRQNIIRVLREDHTKCEREARSHQWRMEKAGVDS